jgi:putative tricarboxylic transport membrane protein
MLGGLIIWGLQPGPMLFREKPDFVWGLIASMYTGNVIGRRDGPGVRAVLRGDLRIPFPILTPLIVAVCAVGSYAVHDSMIDIWYMLLFGVIGYVVQEARLPPRPARAGPRAGRPRGERAPPEPRSCRRGRS